MNCLLKILNTFPILCLFFLLACSSTANKAKKEARLDTELNCESSVHASEGDFFSLQPIPQSENERAVPKHAVHVELWQLLDPIGIPQKNLSDLRTFESIGSQTKLQAFPKKLQRLSWGECDSQSDPQAKLVKQIASVELPLLNSTIHESRFKFLNAFSASDKKELALKFSYLQLRVEANSMGDPKRVALVVGNSSDAQATKELLLLPVEFSQASCLQFEMPTESARESSLLIRFWMQPLTNLSAKLPYPDMLGSANTKSTAEASQKSLSERLSYSTTRRAALLVLGQELQAPLIVDLALLCNEQQLEVLANKLLAKATSVDGSVHKDPMKWVRACILCRVELWTSFQSLELDSVFAQHFGAAANFASSLEELALHSSSLHLLEQNAIDENLIYLQDNSAAQRVQAFDWLRLRKYPLGDYQPLMEAKIRRLEAQKILRQREEGGQS